MNPERWQQIDKLLEQALEQAPDHRSVFLDEACQGDAALRREVESLLSAHDKAEGFTEAVPMRKPARRTGVEEPGLGGGFRAGLALLPACVDSRLRDTAGHTKAGRNP